MTREQLQAMQTTLTVAVPRANAEASRELLVRTAEAERQRVIREQTSRAGYAPSLATVVDGRREASISGVRPDGSILMEWGYAREIAAVAAEALVKAGPYEEGDWATGIVILVNGAEVSRGAGIPHDARDVKLVSTVPYSRRLEIGKTRQGDPFVVEDNDYRLIWSTAMRLRRFYRQVADIDFTYVDLDRAYQLSNKSARTGKRGGQVRYPAITITGWQVQ